MSKVPGYVVVAITRYGKPVRFPVKTLEEAHEVLTDVEEAGGRYASAAIYDESDNEIAGFAK